MKRSIFGFLLITGCFQVSFAYNLWSYWPLPANPKPYDPIYVYYMINQDGDPGCINGDEFQAVQRSFQTWQKILTTYVSLIYSTIYPLTFNLKEEGCPCF